MQPLPIAWRGAETEGSVEGAALLREVPAGPLAAEVGTPTGDRARVDHDLPIDDGEPVQGRARLDLAAADAGAERLRARRCDPPRYFPPPLAGEGQAGGSPLPR